MKLFAFAAVLVAGPLWAFVANEAGGIDAGHGAIRREHIEEHLENIATPRFEGRDSPSPGLRAAADYIAARFDEFGLEPAADSLELLRAHGAAPPASDAPVEGTAAAPRGSFLRPFTRPIEAPVPERCELSAEGLEPFVYGTDFVPVIGCAGEASGELVFAGFGIEDKKERYDDFDKLKLDGKIALIFEGSPRNSKRFGGADGSLSGSLWSKLDRLAAERAAGVLVVRRPLDDHDDYEFDYRYGVAIFLGEPQERPPRNRPPVMEISYEAATRLLGRDARDIAAQIDRSVRPVRVKPKTGVVSFRAETKLADVRVDNVIGVLRGTDDALADEYVIVGAHYDHVGVDLRGRVGFGADDNGSGVSGLLEVTRALAAAKPRRSIIVCAFAAEENGLLGSAAIARRLPVEKSKVVAMVNMDMIGRGEAREVAVLGTERNKHLERLVQRADGLGKTGIRDLVMGRGQELWQRSDQYEFHKIGIPSLFFFEGLPITRNPDYHTWRDTIDKLDLAKIENTTRLVFNTVWLLATEDERPPPSRE